ncbi:MAG: DUF2905 domain-containing protein [Balneolaceae bacterium]|nr:DUF2905 domain-containing protein [Balneolaceae bacterium]
MESNLGRWLIVLGGLILLVGIILYFFGDRLGWLGNLPGDIRIEKENFRFYFPVTTMIVISIVLSLVLTLLSKLFRG